MSMRQTVGMLPPQSIKSFRRDERGVVAVTFGLLGFVIMTFVGAGVDTARWVQARRTTINAMESATLAGLREYQESGDRTKAEALAQKNYEANVLKRSSVVNDNVSFSLDTSGNLIKMKAKGNAKFETNFLRVIPGLETIFVVKTDESENPISELAIGENSGTSLEVSMMLDVTGSMSESDGSGGTKLKAMKDAAKKLIDIVVWDDQSQYTSKVALVPFSEGVNLGATRASAARTSGTPSSFSARNMNSSGNSTWYLTNDCVVERTGSERYTDASYTTARVTPHYVRSSNRACPTTAAVVPLSSNRTTLKNSIDTYTASGVTSGQIGTAWAWYTLSPNFNALWGNSASNARPYADLSLKNDKGRAILNKIAVLMTDGAYNTQFCNQTGFIGIPDQNSGAVSNSNKGRCTSPNGRANDQALALCSGMKAKGITVYTVGFMVGTNEKNLLTQCATSPSHFYDARNGAQLEQAFTDIAYKLVPPFVSH